MIGLGNDLSPVKHQAINLTNEELLVREPADVYITSRVQKVWVVGCVNGYCRYLNGDS